MLCHFRGVFWAQCVLAVLCCACADDPPPVLSAPIGEPLPGLTLAERARFEAGRRQFRRLFSAEDGLGPRFNENACNACHTDPADGGTGEQLVVRATRTDSLATCDLLASDGGPNLRRRVTELAEELGAVAVPIPAASTHSGRFTTPFLFGVGALEAIDTATLEALADPDDRDSDGVSGRLGRTADGSLARFGRKANVASLEDFVDEAFRMEMGITTPRFADETRAGGVPALEAGSDPAPDPEISEVELRATTDFVRFLAPPAPAAGPGIPDVTAGAELFRQLGCDQCHVPALTTGEHEVEALSRRSVGLYSDLLLHDMGPDLASSCAEGASPREFRTEPLMGLRYRESFLHDGRALGVRDAILMHGGEAAGVRARFEALDRVTQQRLLDFLGTL